MRKVLHSLISNNSAYSNSVNSSSDSKSSGFEVTKAPINKFPTLVLILSIRTLSLSEEISS